jgi:hypothetical protein
MVKINQNTITFKQYQKDKEYLLPLHKEEFNYERKKANNSCIVGIQLNNILNRFGDKCLLCGKGYEDLHHWIPIYELKNKIRKGILNPECITDKRLLNDTDNVVPLCHKCHKIIHGRVSEDYYSIRKRIYNQLMVSHKLIPANSSYDDDLHFEDEDVMWVKIKLFLQFIDNVVGNIDNGFDMSKLPFILGTESNIYWGKKEDEQP